MFLEGEGLRSVTKASLVYILRSVTKPHVFNVTDGSEVF